jgi:hypothetical protein
MCDEISAKLWELAQANLIQSWAMSKITQALTMWAIKYGIEMMEEMSLEIGEGDNDVAIGGAINGVDGAFMILYHISNPSPHDAPHLQISFVGQGVADRVFLN